MFRRRIQQMEQQLSNLTAAIVNSDLNLNKSGMIGPILWGHSGPLCHALSLSLSLLLWTSILHCHSPGVATVARRLRYSYSSAHLGSGVDSSDTW